MSSTLLWVMVPYSATVLRKSCGSLVCRWTRRRPPPPATTSDSPRPVTAADERLPGDLLLVAGDDQRLAAVAEALVDRFVAVGERRHAVRGGLARHPGDLVTAAQRLDEPLDEVDEALPAGVDDVAAGEDLELARRVGERLARRLHGAVHRADEVLAVVAPPELVRPGADDGEDGALARVGRAPSRPTPPRGARRRRTRAGRPRRSSPSPRRGRGGTGRRSPRSCRGRRRGRRRRPCGRPRRRPRERSSRAGPRPP